MTAALERELKKARSKPIAAFTKTDRSDRSRGHIATVALDALT